MAKTNYEAIMIAEGLCLHAEAMEDLKLVVKDRQQNGRFWCRGYMHHDINNNAKRTAI
jgi:hypothetical protein